MTVTAEGPKGNPGLSLGLSSEQERCVLFVRRKGELHKHSAPSWWLFYIFSSLGKPVSRNRRRWGRGWYRRWEATENMKLQGMTEGERVVLVVTVWQFCVPGMAYLNRRHKVGRRLAKKRQSPYRDSLKTALLSNSENSFPPWIKHWHLSN